MEVMSLQGFISTSWFYSLNLARVYEISNFSLKIALDRITSDNQNITFFETYPYYKPLYKTPNLINITVYLFKIIFRLLKKLKPKLLGKKLLGRGISIYRELEKCQSKEIYKNTKSN